MALFHHSDRCAAEEDQEDGTGAVDEALIDRLKHIPGRLTGRIDILECTGHDLGQAAFGHALKRTGGNDPGQNHCQTAQNEDQRIHIGKLELLFGCCGFHKVSLLY